MPLLIRLLLLYPYLRVLNQNSHLKQSNACVVRSRLCECMAITGKEITRKEKKIKPGINCYQ